MAVVIETTLGDITVDLFVEQRPQTCLNFIKLCRIKYYNYNLFHMVRSGFIAQTGDPTGEGSGGQSIWGKIFGPDKSFFSGEKMPRIRHTHAGLLSMVCIGDTMVGSQFFFTLAPNLDSLDGVHCVIGAVTEGIDVLRKFNDIICDETYRPYQDVRITHTVILDDPFLDPPGLVLPSRSPSPSAERLACGRIAPDEEIDETKGKTTEEIQEIIEEKEAKARATILEIVGDLPDAEIAPPENVLFVCKLNPVTTDDDLEIIFSRFGKIVSCEVIRDRKTGDSLQYAFIEFADKKSCEDAYFKMDNVLIDDRRIHVDFSQSVSKIKWLGKGKGVRYISDNGPKDNNDFETNSRRSKSRENFSRARNERNRDKERKEKREHKNRSRSRSRHRQSPSKNKYERKRRQDRTSNDKSPRSSDRHHNSRTHRNEYKTRDSHSSNKNVKDIKIKSAPTCHKEKYSRDKAMDHSVNGKKKKDGVSSSVKKKYENENMDKSTTVTKKSKYKNRDEKSPGTPPKDRNLKSKIRKESSSKKSDKNNVKSVKKKRKPSSTSSDTESSASSSSSESSSSSDSDSKKKKQKRKRKLSTSSSSSSSTTSSSTSVSESSSSSESSSGGSNNKRRKRKKVETKKYIKKSKNK